MRKRINISHIWTEQQLGFKIHTNIHTCINLSAYLFMGTSNRGNKGSREGSSKGIYL